MKTKLYSIRLIPFLVLSFISTYSYSQITGSVFRDINNDGVQQSVNPEEPGEYGVTVKAYNAANILIGTTTTNNNGDYAFSAGIAPAGLAVRVEFMVKAGDQPSKRIAANKSNVQFVLAGPSAVEVNFAVANKKWFADNSNPYVATTAYTNGDANSSGAQSAGDNDNLYVFPYDLSSDGGHTRRAQNKYLGSIFGLGWQRESRTLLMAAYLKRHSGFGPNGIGAIYESQIAKDGVPSTPKLLVDVTAIGINVGSDPRTGSLPANSSTPNTDNGVFAEVGKRGIGGIELSVDGRDLYLVNMYEKKLQRINVGNPFKASFTSADVTGSWLIPDPSIAGTEWHPMAVEMHDGKLFVGGVTAQQTTSAHDVNDTVNLRGIVYEFNLTTQTFTQVLNFSLSHRRGFTNTDFRYANRNNYWSGWQNNGDITIGGPLRAGLLGLPIGGNATGIYYPQPMLCNIEFDVDGSMILGIRDRFGDQGGYANYFESGNTPGETYRVLASGEVLRAGRTSTGWQLENKGSVTNDGVTTTTPGLTDNTPSLLGSFLALLGTPWGGPMGPGGGYYYYNQNFSKTGVPGISAANTNVSHYVKSNGGVAVFPGYNEVMTTAIDPAGSSYTNGILKNFNLGSNAGNMAGRMELIANSNPNDPTNMGKAAALGDMELLLDAEAMEIGNRVWDDANGNGRQDPQESGIANVTVQLRSPGLDGVYGNGDDQVWTVVTDAEGHYYFDATIVNDTRRPDSWIGVSDVNSGILPGFEYRVEIDKTQPALLSLFVSPKNFAGNKSIDSDGSPVGNTVQYIVNPGGSTAVNSEFSNDYNVDFGFTTSVLPLKKLDLTAFLLDNNVQLHWTTVDESGVKKYHIERSVDGKNFTEIGTQYAKGDGSFDYVAKDDIKNLTASTVYYRLLIEEIKGASSYSATVKVNPGKSMQVQISPNPFISNLTVQVNSARRTDASIRIHNAAGQLVYTKTLLLEKGITGIALSEFQQFSRGMYVIEVKSAETYYSQKLLKQ
jgi:trimeric autotransporter adhesin